MIRKLTVDELATMFCKEKVMPLDKAFSILDADDPLAEAAALAENVFPVGDGVRRDTQTCRRH